MKKRATTLAQAAVSPDSVSADERRVLRTRAQHLARPLANSMLAGASLELLEFRLAQEHYALETRHVREVRVLQNLTAMPCTPAFLRGVVNVRGHIVPVIDIKQFFDLPDKGQRDLHSIILVHGHNLTLGLLADSIGGVRSVPLDSLQPALSSFSGIRSDYLQGVTAERLVVLAVDRILTDPGIIVHEQVKN